jgi:hypothetical protein
LAKHKLALKETEHFQFQDKATMEETEIKADDSDYYTPEDPHTTILSPVKSPTDSIEKVNLLSNFLMNQNLTKFIFLEGHCQAISCYKRHRTPRQSNISKLAGIDKKFWR